MPDLSRLAKLVERVSLDEFALRLQPEADGALSGEVSLEELRVRDEIRVERGRVQLSGVKLGKKMPALLEGVVLQVPEVRLTIAPEYWQVLAEVAGQEKLSKLGEALDEVRLDGFRLETSTPEDAIRVEGSLERLAVLHQDKERIASEGSVELSGLKPQAGFPAMLDGLEFVKEAELRFGSALWTNLSEAVGVELLAGLGEVFDRFRVDAVTLNVSAPDKQVSGELTLDRATVSHDENERVTAAGKLVFEGLEPGKKFPAMLDGFTLTVQQFEKRFAAGLWASLAQLLSQERLKTVADLLTRVAFRGLETRLVADEETLGCQVDLDRFLVAHEDQERVGLHGLVEMAGLKIGGGFPDMLDGMVVRIPEGHLDLAPELFITASKIAGVSQLEDLVDIVDRVGLTEFQLEVAAGDSIDLAFHLAGLAVSRHEKERVILSDGEVRVEGLTVGGGLDKLLDGMVVRLPGLTVRLEDPLWEPLSRLAGESAAANLGQVLNRIELRDIAVSLAASGNVLDIGLTVDSVEVFHNLFRGVRVEELELKVKGFELGGDPKTALEKSAVTLSGLKVRVAGDLLNRGAAAFQDKISSWMESVDFSLGKEQMVVNAAIKKGATVRGRVTLRFEAEDNKLRVHWEGFKAVGVPLPEVMRKVFLWFVEQFVEQFVGGKKGIHTSDDFLEIDPWVHVPFKVDATITRFAVEGDEIVVEFA